MDGAATNGAAAAESTAAPERFDQWAILELMGHRRLAGRVREVELFGTKMCRIDSPRADGSEVTQFYGGSSIYGLTPVSEEVARKVAARCEPEPVSPWELKEAPPALPRLARDYAPRNDGDDGLDLE